MNQNRFFFLLVVFISAFYIQVLAKDYNKVCFEKTIYEGKPHYVVKTKSITWYFDREGGGFSRMIDNDGNDWISFKREPWGMYPASAASAFRGIPNLVFQGDDGGAGHPGHEKCISKIEGKKIVTESKSGKWKWNWEFFDDYAVLETIKTDGNQPFWFLYEGTPGGSFSPGNYYYGTSSAPVTTEIPDYFKGETIYLDFQWIFCGDRTQKKVFYMLHFDKDDKIDMLGFLGNTKEGLNSPDGMTVFGFGRDKNTNPLLTGNQKFVVGFYPDLLTERKQQDEFQNFLKKEFKIK